MKINKWLRLSVIVLLLGVLFQLSSCYNAENRKYYADKNNYVAATGTVSYIRYDTSPTTWVCIAFDDLEPNVFSENCFKLIGDNADITLKRGIKEKLKEGDHIEFISAPQYFGDGYIMPIVAITVNGEELLTFEEGYAGLLKFLK